MLMEKKFLISIQIFMQVFLLRCSFTLKQETSLENSFCSNMKYKALVQRLRGKCLFPHSAPALSVMML